MVKENILITKSKRMIILISPLISIIIGLLLWGTISIWENIILIEKNNGILLVLAISSINVYSVLLAGWSSNSRYSLIGSVRSICQYISYEIYLGLMIINVLLIRK